MSRYHRLQLLATAFFVLCSVIAPLTSFAQQATPIADETPTPTAEVTVAPLDTSKNLVSDDKPAATTQAANSPDEIPADEVDDDPTLTPAVEAKTPMKMSGLGMGLMSTGGPQVTVNGSTTDVVVLSGSRVSIGIPVGAEAARFESADCTGEPSPWRTESYDYVFDGGVLSVQARSVSDPSSVGPCVKITSVVSPNVTFNGSLGPIYVLVNTSIVPEFPTGAEWAKFSDSSCSDATPTWLNYRPFITESQPVSVWFQARDIQYQQYRGTCVEVNWVNAPTMAMNESAVSLILLVQTGATPTFSAGSAWNSYSGAGCIAENVLTTGSTSTDSITSSVQVTRSYQAHLVVASHIQSNCVTVTWRPATPTVTINSQTESVIVRNGVPVTPEIPEGAEWGVYNSASCEGVATWYPPGPILGANGSTSSFRARWIDDPDALGNCVTVNWRANPIISINGQTEHVVLPPSGDPVVPDMPEDASWAVFADVSCSGDPESPGWQEPSATISSPSFRQVGIQARRGDDDASRGNCLKVSFATPPTLTVNGASVPVTALMGTNVSVSTSSGGEWAGFVTADCSGDVARSWSLQSETILLPVPGTISFQARLVSANDVRSACILVTSVAPPTLMVNGFGDPVTVTAGTGVNVAVTPGAEWTFFESVDCSGSANEWSSGSTSVVRNAATTLSFRARLIGIPSNEGNCIAVTWRPTSPTTSVNGQTSSFMVPIGTEVRTDLVPGAEAAVFLGGVCVGDPGSPWEERVGGSLPLPGTYSFQMRWKGEDNSRGNCVTVTWRPAKPTMQVNGSTGPLTLVNGASAIPAFPDGAEWNTFAGDACWGNPLETWSGSGGSVAKSDGYWSFQARWGDDDDTRGNCVAVLWRPATPTITAKGETETLNLVASNSVLPVFPAGAKFAIFNNADCSGGSSEYWTDVETVIVREGGTVLSVQARWIDNEQRGNCVTISWAPVSVPALASEVCGSDNDVITPPSPQYGVTVGDTGWSNNQRTITLTAAQGTKFPTNQQTVFEFTDEGPCVTDAPLAPAHAEVCGIDNDTVTVSDQPANVLVSQSSAWSDTHTWTVTFSAAADHALPGDTQTEYVFTDTGPCMTDAPVPPVQAAICGIDNDTVTIPDQPANVRFTQSDGWSVTHTWTVTFSAAEHHALPDGTQTEYVFTDAGLCVTDAPIPPVHAAICGVDNDRVTTPDQPANVVVDDTGWVDGTRTITFSAAEHHALPDGTQTEYVFTDAGLCVTDAPIPTVHAAVCGIDNDSVTIPDQPANVVVDDTGWVDGQRTIIFSAAEDHALPDGTQTEYVFTDNGLCDTNAPISPVTTAVCGPDNDLVTLAESQPQGVSLESDTGWIDNARTITYAVDPQYTVVGATTFTLTDDNEPCAPETRQVIVQLETSDGGSIEGAPYALYAPIASQQMLVTPYIEGVVGASNQIVLNDLAPGTYRITINAVGYEPVDEVIAIENGDGAQTIALKVNAIQVSTPTPTVSAPTPEPTISVVTPEPTTSVVTPDPTTSVVTPEPTTGVATPVPTTDVATSEPTATMAVSGLPSTGAGDPGGYLWLATGLFGLVLMVVGVGMQRRERRT